MTLSLLFSFYSNLMLTYYAPDKSEQGIANMLGLRTPWQARDYMAAMRKYSGVKTMQIVGEIRYADAKSKGVQNSSMTDGDILRELVFKNFALTRIKNYIYHQTYTFTIDRNGEYMSFYIPAIILISKRPLTIFCDYFYK